MDSRTTVFLLALILSIPANAALLGPTPYLSFANSPFSSLSFQYFHLENFESGSLTVPGVTPSGGVVIGPSAQTDSVDGDDGSMDGSGAQGHSFFSNGLTQSFTFAFSAAVLVTLPTHVGLVWTDVGNAPTPGVDNVRFEAFDQNGVSLGMIGPVLLGDGSTFGGTAEDRFFGVTNPGGISSITLSMANSSDWEIDHLQFGAVSTVPEPTTFFLAGVTLMVVIAGSRRRSRRHGFADSCSTPHEEPAR